MISIRTQPIHCHPTLGLVACRPPIRPGLGLHPITLYSMCMSFLYEFRACAYPLLLHVVHVYVPPWMCPLHLHVLCMYTLSLNTFRVLALGLYVNSVVDSVRVSSHLNAVHANILHVCSLCAHSVNVPSVYVMYMFPQGYVSPCVCSSVQMSPMCVYPSLVNVPSMCIPCAYLLTCMLHLCRSVCK